MAQTSMDDYLMHSFSLFDVDWNAIDTNSLSYNKPFSYTINSFDNPSRSRLRTSNERTIVASLYNRIATDAASITIKHVRTNQNGRYQEDMDSNFNKCLTIEANIDQTGRELIFDAIISMFDEGVVAIVPTETIVSMKDNNSFDILSMRTAKILSWKPQEVRVQIYNDTTGTNEELWLPKSKIAIIQNPFYGVMNQQGSVAKRLIEKLNQSDIIDNKNVNSKLDLLLQVPYNLKSPALKKKAEERVSSLKDQIQNSEYGIGMVDATEKVVQLNRSIENNMMPHVEWLTEMLYSQLGISKTIFNGTASEQENLNYQNQTIEPILSAFANEFKRKFLSKTARSQNQDVMFFRDPFRIVPMDEMAELGDKFIRNEILSSNEVREIVGFKPSEDSKADELRNPNMPQGDDSGLDSTNVNTEFEIDETI